MPRTDAPPLPGLARHTLLLWQLRLWLTGSQQPGQARRARLLALLAYLASASPAIPLFWAGWRLLTWEPVAASLLWTRFFFDLLAFVSTTVWIFWPVLAADVDDHAEVSRFATLPIAPLRLLVASTAAALFEPLALVVSAPVLGASLAFLSRHPPRSWALVVLALLGWALLSIAWSRAALHLVLGVLRQKRGAQAVGGFFLGVLFVSVFIPPVDVSWLTAAAGSFGALSPKFLLEASLGLSRVPTGFLGEALRLLAQGRLLGPALEVMGLLFFTWVGLFVAWRALLRFHRRGGEAGAGRGGRTDRFLSGARDLPSLLARREIIDLWRNPRARLLAFVPLILAVAMRLLSLRPLVVHWRGESADAWIVAGLTSYGVVVFSLTFAQNAFGYDGRSLGMLLAAPLEPALILRAKLRVLAGLSLLVAAVQCAFYSLYLSEGGLVPFGLGLAATACLVPALLLTGAFVSVRYATPYHANLERRDQQPRVAIVTGMIAAALGGAPLGLILWRNGEAAPTGGDVALLATIALAYALAFRLLRPLAEAHFVRRREAVLDALRAD
ncbi:MAG: hypothetical protein P1V51_04710 [Deltaproteobacteria bacterium]|nr:hypothetical protein [Deltaproteobacteria bacterium]